LFVVIFLGVILHIYMPNLGGAGLSLPINIISCCSVALFIVVMSGSQLNKNNFHYSVASQWISIGLIILIVLCFLSPATYRYSAYLIAAWIVGALIFYCLLLQVNITEVGYEIILWSIIFSAIVESILAFLQVFDLLPLIRFSYPSLSGDRPYGIFQQVNVFSSFICIGVASALGLIIKLNNKSQNKKIMIGISLILMSSVLPLSQSLTGYLSLFLIVIAFFVFSKNNRKEITFLFLFVIIGLVIGYGI
ncbi:pilin glycosylation ligase domain-containing protein, partial [Providencia heimbachae]